MTNNIVTVNVTQTVAPTPSTLQSTGALISQGGTTGVADTITLLTQLSDLTSILATAAAIATLAWSANVVTATTSSAHGIPSGHSVLVTIAGATPSAYNGTFLATSTGTTTFTYPLVGNPGAETVPGTWIPAAVSELTAMATTFFAQGSAQAVYVLELGIGSAADGVTALAAYITANPNSNYTPGSVGYFYAYLVPREWGSESTYLTFLAGFEATTSKTYFFTTMTTGNYTSYTALMKCVVGLVEAPGIPASEFSLASAFYVALNYRPSSTNKVTPYAFSFLFGVTPYPTKGNGALLAALKAAKVNYIGTGAVGGISNTILFWGTTMDGRPFTYWYSVDWLQITVDIDISNAVINGSNNPANPLYFNQDGINRLQAVGAQTLVNGVTYGLANGTVTQTEDIPTDLQTAINSGALAGKLFINAVPFVPYNVENPSDYKNGEYDGFTVGYITQNGFIHILFNVNVSDFITQ